MIGEEITTDIFIKRSIDKHGDKYDYSSTIYKNMKSYVTIVCKKHNYLFYQTPYGHLASKSGGCGKCNPVGKGCSNNDIFINKSILLHGDKYSYDLVDYISSNKKVTIVCNIHGRFMITPNSHLNGRGCRKCAGNHKYEISELISIFNKKYYNKYEYDFSDYKNIKSRVKVKCPNHSYFETSAELLLNGYGCSSCGKLSIGEERVSKYLTNKGIEYEKQKTFDGCFYTNKMQFDFYIPEKNVCIEYDGKQHFEPIEYFGGVNSYKEQIIKDEIKNSFCAERGIKLIRIPYYQYNNIEKILHSEL